MITMKDLQARRVARLAVAGAFLALVHIGSTVAQNAMNCRSDYSNFDRVIAANLNSLRKDPTDRAAFASINAFMAELMAKEPRRRVIEGPFDPVPKPRSLG